MVGEIKDIGQSLLTALSVWSHHYYLAHHPSNHQN